MTADIRDELTACRDELQFNRNLADDLSTKLREAIRERDDARTSITVFLDAVLQRGTPLAHAYADRGHELKEAVAVLRDLVERCDGEEGVREDGSNIWTMRAHAFLDKYGAR